MAPKEQQKLLFWCCICTPSVCNDLPNVNTHGTPHKSIKTCSHRRLPKGPASKVCGNIRSIPIHENQSDKNMKKACTNYRCIATEDHTRGPAPEHLQWMRRCNGQYHTHCKQQHQLLFWCCLLFVFY
ncbi:hypothetical protein BS47DRAFT_1367489 [Hydnum rufescens UP504]|uniref:Uncharacterized protein n=1 Tax=Hydnum rufescens UP504 TaxID=1448309 RepID=A0A9P6DPF6_9AGAM|nr:hypothetical protein BS47DRAFT_1367489 [Hydnum rufescens UP504]